MKEMRFTFGLIFFLFIYSMAHSQENRPIISFDSLVHKKIYRIEFSDYQLVEFISFQNQTFSGRVINSVWKTNRKGIKNKLKYDINHIDPLDVDMLFDELLETNIEILPTCSNLEGCVVGMDGLYVSFNINTSNGSRNYWYWEPENDRYQNSNIPEIKNVRKILAIIKSKINLQGLFEEFKDSLPNGTYSFGGIVMQKLD